jgi:hypothetical protein
MGFKLAVPMKMRITGRVRPVQGEKGMFIYRRGASISSDAVNRHQLRLYQTPPAMICHPGKSESCPASISRATYLFEKAYQMRKRMPEPTVKESIELLIPSRLED